MVPGLSIGRGAWFGAVLRCTACRAFIRHEHRTSLQMDATGRQSLLADHADRERGCIRSPAGSLREPQVSCAALPACDRQAMSRRMVVRAATTLTSAATPISSPAAAAKGSGEPLVTL